MAINKDTTPTYRIAKTVIRTQLETLILSEHGDTVVVTDLIDDPEDSTFLIIKTG